MTRAAVVTRARGAIGHGTRYQLGAGGFHPESPHPWNPQHELDCSGFASWCLGISRHTGNPWFVAHNGGWIETTAIVTDAHLHVSGDHQGLFRAVPWPDAVPSDLVVYGDHGGHQGHVGVVSDTNAQGPTTVVHCSHGNWLRMADAIQETGPGGWRRPDATVARAVWITT